MISLRRLHLITLSLTVFMTLLALDVMAQSAPAKPALKASSKPAPKAAAEPAPRPDPIMSKDELRACMLMKRENDAEVAKLKADQKAFTEEYDAIKAEQGAVKAEAERLQQTANGLRQDEERIGQRRTELAEQLAQAKGEEEKTRLEQERLRLLDGLRQNERQRSELNAALSAHRQRVEALNLRIGAINERSKTVNDRVEPLQAKTEAWRSQCGNRRYREEDEIALKRELGI